MKTIYAAGAAALALLANPAAAEDMAGKVQVKVLGTAVLPDGKITDLETPLPGVTDGVQTEANDNFVPTVAIEYFFSNNFSVETICCMTQHDVDANAGLPGAELVSNARLIPATVTAKYHFDLGPAKPYVGVGPTYFLWVSDKPGQAAVDLGVNGFSLSDELGFALQAGIDIPVNESGMAVTLDAKRYFVDTHAKWYVDDTLVIATKHKLDPWVLSAGVAFAF